MNTKQAETSKYRGVGWSKSRNCWRARMQLENGFEWTMFDESERKCALEYDRKRLEDGKTALNILKPLVK